MKELSLLAREWRDAAATRRACLLGERLGHVLVLKLIIKAKRANAHRSISPNTMSSEPMIAETSAGMCLGTSQIRAPFAICRAGQAPCRSMTSLAKAPGPQAARRL